MKDPHPAGPPATGQRLDEQLCFALYSTTLAMNKIYRGLLRDLGITYPQYLVLLVLWETDALMVSNIGECLFLDSATLTPLLKRMESQGLLRRTRAQDDQRQVIVTLTPAGRALQTQAGSVPEGVFCATGCEPDALLALREQLVRLRARLLANA